ncbi:MAG TPA: hypothetical protein VHX15_20355 [Frankiaceae bacterium]|nr:hypothetical protein [Frankiaceae bacterium]
MRALQPDVRHAVILAIEHVTAMSLSEVPVEFVPLDPPRGRDRAQALLDALLLLCQQLVHDLCEAESMDPVAVLQRVTAEVAGY